MKHFFAKSATVLVLAALLSPVAVFAEDQPHMRAALDALQKAKQELQAAEHDKGGHRTKALNLTDRAIQQVQAGINYDIKHESGKGRRQR